MKKLLFVACLLVPLGLIAYGKLKPYYENYKTVTEVTSVIREIPLTAPKLDDAFKQFPSVPSVAPKKYPIITGPAKPVKPTNIKPRPRHAVPVCTPVAPNAPLTILPDAREPTERCTFGFLSMHCAFQ